VIVLDEQHLLSVLREFVAYYNQDRPHRRLGLQTPEQEARSTTGSHPITGGAERTSPRVRAPLESGRGIAARQLQATGASEHLLSWARARPEPGTGLLGSDCSPDQPDLHQSRARCAWVRGPSSYHIHPLPVDSRAQPP
jgi:hypothetical protein